MEQTNEKTDNVVLIYAKGEDKMRIRFVDAIKIGFGIYVGYNLAQALKNSIKISVNEK